MVDDGPEDLQTRTRALFAQMQDGGEYDAEHARGQLVELHLPLAEYLARRFGNRGELHEDLVQVATIGLIKAIDRFDLERGVAFSTYATPTIVGEIKRHFRDRGWTIRVPRRLQEIQAVINQAVGDLGQELGRSPTVAEIAGPGRDERGGDPRGAGVGERLQPACRSTHPTPAARWARSSSSSATRTTPCRQSSTGRR